MKQLTSTVGMPVTVDPLDGFRDIKEERLIEAIGLLGHFAAEVYLQAPESVEDAFRDLMEVYQMGYGQDGSGWGTVEDMVYKSEHEGDPDMDPLVAFHLSDTIDFLVYQYAICAVTDGTETLMMRLD